MSCVENYCYPLLCRLCYQGLLLSAAGLLLLGVVVHSLQQKQHLLMHGLRKQIHSHGSHRTERSAVDSVGWCSAQTGDEFIYFREPNLLNSIYNKPNGTHSIKLFMAALALQATYTSLLRCSALLIARMTLESAINLMSFQGETSLRFGGVSLT